MALKKNLPTLRNNNVLPFLKVFLNSMIMCIALVGMASCDFSFTGDDDEEEEEEDYRYEELTYSSGDLTFSTNGKSTVIVTASNPEATAIDIPETVEFN